VISPPAAKKAATSLSRRALASIFTFLGFACIIVFSFGAYAIELMRIPRGVTVAA
jgi:hypothetical protein